MAKVRDSGMPGEAYWESLFSVDTILEKMKINSDLQDVVEIGFGYGTFTIPVAKIIKGKIIAFDIDESLVPGFKNRIDKLNIRNIEYKIKDVLVEGVEIGDSSVDYYMLFNILHTEYPDMFLKEAYRVVKPGGFCGVIHWRSDIPTPRGPAIDIRPKPEFIKLLLESSGFAIEEQNLILEPFHFGVLGRK
ncbi:methyltransferase domain protein [Leptospira fainei serovar Hurstbridge str. BUT 6]|uniref:Methyltransferase domain protein n=1 Tax=Leptospira fainei serovar Hurstbridge str. BUT 6 TaxID=1193011 RepID=S3VEQ4_9LEPT|nr:class I SAM-dependent methyltransferase [Leptospira fainei]EPG74965.1 methyltransferase domain protein [Leptospira fainei serovar Hurstbridge str. BUT 6]